MKLRMLFLAVAVSAGAGAQPMPSDVRAAMSAGIVGERYDGYLGYAGAPSPQIRREVSAINIQRRNLYTQLAVRRNVSPAIVSVATGCELLGRLTAGQSYMLKGGAWRRLPPGRPAPRPDYCE
jgi:uncharacterized protein YdbL (DUF1318 family)